MTAERLHFRSLRSAGEGPALAFNASRAHDFVLVGAMTPHDADTGALTTSMASLPERAQKDLRTGVYFVDSQQDRVKAQAWRALANLSEALALFGSDFSRLAFLRVLLRDMRDEPAVLDVLRCVVGELPAGEVVEAWSPGAPENVDVQIDAIALAGLAQRANIRIAGLDDLVAPFAVATRGGDLLFSSCLPGADAERGELNHRLRDVALEERELAQGALGTITRRVESYLAQQLTTWSHYHRILADQNIPRTNLLLNFAWVRRSMREMADGYSNRHLLRSTGSKHCLTTFPVSGLRFPDALIEGRIVAVYPDAKRPKQIKAPDHGMSGAYVGAVEGGGLIFTAGEVPVQTEAGHPIRSAVDLEDEMRRLNFGRYHAESLIMPQADYVLKKLRKTLAHYGVGFPDVAHQTIYLTNPDDYPALERIATLYFGATLPPTTIVPIHRPSNSPEARLEYEITLASR